MRAPYFYSFCLLLLSTLAFAQPNWQNATNIPATGVTGMTPLLRRENGSIGIVVNLDAKSTVYYVIYTAANDPGVGAITAAAIKAGTTPGTKQATGFFVFGDGSYCRNVYPANSLAQCAAVDGDIASDRAISVNVPVAGAPTYVVYFTAESIAAPGTLTGVVNKSILINTVQRSCLRVGSNTLGPIPVFSPNLSNNCSPASFNLTVGYVGVDFSSAFPVLANVNFGDASAFGTDQTLALQNSPLGTAEQNKAFRLYQTDFAKVYDYNASANPAANPTGSGCTFLVEVEFNAGVTDCSSVGGVDQFTTVTVWDKPNTPRGLQDVNPNGLNSDDAFADDEEFETCEGSRTTITLIDNSVFNCTTVEDARAAIPLPNSPNREARWVQFVYGAAGTTVTTSGAVNDQVTIGGVNFTAAQLPIYGPVVYIPASIAANPLTQALPVIMPINAPPGAVLMIEMRSWNTCLPYDNDVSDGGLNPTGGTFDLDLGANNNNNWITQTGAIGGWPGNQLTFPNANTTPITFQKPIVIVDSPSPPVVPNVDICSSEPRTIKVNPTLGAGFQYRLWTNATATTEQTGVGSPSTTGTFTNVPVNDGQRIHYWVTVESTGVDGCRSQPTEVTITRRPALGTPNAPTGPPNLCPSTTGYTYTTTTTPDNVDMDDTSIAGAVNFTLTTEMVWTVPAAVGTLTAGTGTSTITVTSNAAAGNGDVTVGRRYVTVTAPVNPPTASSQCLSSTSLLRVNVRNRPTAGITPNTVDICEGTVVPLNGNPVLPTAAAPGFVPTIASHAWTGSTGILSATNVVNPNVIGTALPGSYNVVYVVTADYGTGVSCASVAVNRDVDISDNTAPAAVGANQALCGTLTSNPMGGSDPSPGNGTWTFVSSVPVRPAPSISNNIDPNATITITAGNEGAYTMRWRVVSGTCISQADIVVDLGSNPTDPLAGGDQTVCGESASLAGNTPIIGAGVWSVVSGPGACAGVGCPITITNPLSPSSTVTLNGPAFTYGAYTLRWTITSGTCVAEQDDVIITFHQAATVSAMANFSSCLNSAAIGTPIPLTGTIGGGATQGQWIITSGGGSIQTPGAQAGPTINNNYIPVAGDFVAGTISVKLVALDPDGLGITNPCVAVETPVTITKDLLPLAAVAGGNFETCGPTENLGATAATNGGTGTWTVGGAIYYETFPTTDNGVGLTGPSGATTFNHPGGNWSVTVPAGALPNNTHWIRVEAGKMKARDVSGTEVIWQSRVINITGSVTVSADITEIGAQVGGDYINMFYKINGGAEIPFGSVLGNLAIDGQIQTVTATTPVGATVQIVMRARNSGTPDEHVLDNVIVSAAGALLPVIADIHDPASAVSNLQVGVNSFTWTVQSALSVCGSSFSPVTITRHPSPVALDPLPELCEDALNPAEATVTAAYLASALITDGVTGILNSTNRTVQFFTDATRLIPVPDPYLVSNGEIIYTRVTQTNTSPQCQTDGIITFRVNLRPAAIDPNPEFCESTVGSNTLTGINLSTFDNTVKNGVGANSVAWFADATLLTQIIPPTVTANNGSSFYAQVTDGKGCTKSVEVQITLNPRPVPNTLLGPTDVCADPTAVTLYQLTVNNSAIGYTYTWSIPEPPFDRIIGGTGSDFLVLLSFPTVVNPGQNISVIETSAKGCAGNPNVRNIKVDTSPPAITILDNPLDPLSVGPGSVCEGEAGVVYTVANLANTTYAWTVPPGSSIIGGQGTNQITVNFGTIGGLISVVPTTTTGCAGNPDDYAVAIIPRPSLNTSPNTVCSDVDANITLSGTVSPGSVTSFNITNVSVPPGLSPASRPFPLLGVLSDEIEDHQYTNTTGGNLTVQYTVVPISAAGCEGPPQIVNLTIRPEPVLAPNLNDVICSTTDAVGVVLSVASGSFPADEYVIASINNPSGLIQIAGSQALGVGHPSGILLDDKWENKTGAAATIEYLVHPRNSTTTCMGDPAIPVIITVNPEPIVTPIALETICSGDSPLTTVSPSISASTFNWTVSSIDPSITGNTNGSGPFGSAITDVLINISPTLASLTYSVTATGPAALGSCTGPAEDFVVDINPSPTATGVNQILCSDASAGSTVLFNLRTLENTIGGAGPTYTWSENISMVPLIAAPTAYVLSSGSVFVEVDNGQCSKIVAVTTTINERPSVTSSITSSYSGLQLSCNGASDGQITAVPADGTSPYLFSLNGGSFFTTPTFNGLSVAGNNYTVSVRDANGCSASAAPLTIIPPTAVSATAAITSDFNGEDVSCQTASDGKIEVTPAGGTGAGTYTFRLLELPSNISGNGTGIYTGLRAGTYTFVVRDGNGCQFTIPTITVNEPSPVLASAVLTTPVTCNGNSNGVITTTASGGTLVTNYTFTLSPGGTNNTTGIFNGLAAGNYTVTVADDNGCPKTSNTVSVTQPPVLTAFASVTSNYNGAKISCVGASDAQVTAVANGGNGGFTYVLDQDLLNTTGAADGSFEGLGPGNYTITVSSVGPCTVVSTPVNVTEPTAITASAVVTGTISCNGGSDGQITVSGSGGTGAYSFEQVSPAGATNVSGIFSSLSQGSFDFEVSDKNFCSDIVTLVINQPTIVTASAVVTSNYNGAQITCAGASNGVITVNGGGGTGSLTYVFDQFALTNTTGQFSGVFIGVPANPGYTFTVKDSKNCTALTTPVTITPPTAVAASGSVTSNYTGEDIRCVGSSDGVITILASGGTGAYNYKLDQVPSNTSGDPLGIYTGLSAGTYTVTARDINSCFIVTAPITVTPPAPLTGNATVSVPYLGGRQISCNGASNGEITVSSGGGVGGFDFAIIEIPGNATGATTGTFTGVPAGNYTIRITDDNNCQRITPAVTIVEPPVLAAVSAITSNYNGAQITCNGASDGTIKITPTGGTATYTYAFVEIPGNGTGATSGIFTGVPAGVYTFNVRDLNLCPVTTAAITISAPTPVIASADVEEPYNGQQISCNGVDDGVVTVTSSGGTGAITYVFNQFAATNLSGKFSGIFSGVEAGTGYTFTATDINGCPVTTSVVDVSEPAAISATLNASSDFSGFDISCFNKTDGVITVVTPAGGTGALSYLLMENPGNVTGATLGVFSGLRAGSYRVRITDQNFCQFMTAAIPVTQPTDINVQIAISSNYNGFDISCLGASDGAVNVTTIAGGATASGVTYVLDQDLSNGTGNASGAYTGLVSGLYTITAKDANGCPKQSLPVVMLDPLPLFEGIVGLDKSVCVGSDPTAFTELATAFGGIGNYAYQWQQSGDGVTFSDIATATSATFDPPVAPLSPVPVITFYKRKITSGTCVTLESNIVKVTANPLPTATMIPSKTPVCEGDFFLVEFAFTGQAPFYFDYNSLALDGTTSSVNDRLGAANTPVPILNYTSTTTYTMTELRDFNGCVATALPVPVTVPVIKINPAFAITSSNAQCSGGQFDFQFTKDPDVEYTWIWGDGQTQVIPADPAATGTLQPISHTYRSFNTSGTTNFPVILTAINNVNGCGPKQTNQSIQVFPNILVALFPDKTEICGGDQVTFNNPTAGGTNHHWFFREQGVVEKRDERTFVAASDQTFTFNNTTIQNPITYELVYEVNNANCSADTVIEITVYREVAANFSIPSGIPQFIGGNANMSFTNTSVPIDGTEFQYDWDFGTGALQGPVSSLGPFNFNYIAPGTKTVRLLATNLVALANGLTCTSLHQETFNIVLPPLIAGFEYTPQATCFPANIVITKNIATGNTFEWRLVDGNGRQLLVSNDTLPTFLISSPGRYTIFQTTKNTLTGQTASADNSEPGNNILAGIPTQDEAYNIPIDIYEPPFAGFTARPTVVYVPDTQLQVFNMSSSPVDPQTATSYPIEYKWYFGDGADTLSTADDPNNFEPSHFYLNEGPYQIALLAVNDHGNGAICIDTATQVIQAKAAGFTRIPNAFTPSPNGPTGGAGGGGNSVNDVFLPVAKGIVDFQMQIYDRWGNLVFESKDKTFGWDGYDKNGNLLPAGVYVYKLVLRLSNDQRTTQLGDVTLIR